MTCVISATSCRSKNRSKFIVLPRCAICGGSQSTSLKSSSLGAEIELATRGKLCKNSESKPPLARLLFESPACRLCDRHPPASARHDPMSDRVENNERPSAFMRHAGRPADVGRRSPSRQFVGRRRRRVDRRASGCVFTSPDRRRRRCRRRVRCVQNCRREAPVFTVVGILFIRSVKWARRSYKVGIV